MSLLSYLLGDSLDELIAPALPSLYRSASLLDHHDDMATHPRLTSGGGPIRSGHLHPWRHTPVITNFLHPHHPHHHVAAAARQHAKAAARKDKKRKDSFQVNLDVQQFQPDEIDVKIVDGFIVVEAKHEERLDEHGFIAREFKRRYRVPEEFDIDAVSSKLSSDGVLSIEAPKKTNELPNKERIIPITQTHAPAVTGQPSAESKGAENENGTEKMDQ